MGGSSLFGTSGLEDIGPNLVRAPANLLGRWQVKFQYRVQRASDASPLWFSAGSGDLHNEPWQKISLSPSLSPSASPSSPGPPPAFLSSAPYSLSLISSPPSTSPFSSSSPSSLSQHSPAPSSSPPIKSRDTHLPSHVKLNSRQNSKHCSEAASNQILEEGSGQQAEMQEGEGRGKSKPCIFTRRKSKLKRSVAPVTCGQMGGEMGARVRERGGGGEVEISQLHSVPSLQFADRWAPAVGEGEEKGGSEEREGENGEVYGRGGSRSMVALVGHGGKLPVCSETLNGLKKQYFAKSKHKRGHQKDVFEVVHVDERPGPLQALVNLATSYILPEGYPDSVASSYSPYMRWRSVQYFFGGAMSVFTTRSLLHSLGVSKSGSMSGALAVNWVIKDGAGRIGKMLFARHGKKFDCDLKQFRFAGAMLMEAGAGVELATMVFPKLFLPLACAANVAKNVAAVTATATRAPVYKAFARRENLGDVTAKGESVSNLSDLLGTGLGIFLSKKNPSLVATFCVLSCGYLFGSYQEVRSVQLPTLNRARFSVAVRTYLETGRVPSLDEVNRKEKILVMPWADEQPLQLGVSVTDAFQSPSEFQDAQRAFQDEKYLVAYWPRKQRAYVVLKEGAQSESVLQAAFQANVLLYFLRRKVKERQKGGGGGGRGSFRSLSDADVAESVAESCRHTRTHFKSFREEAVAQGWTMAEWLLNPGDARLCAD